MNMMPEFLVTLYCCMIPGCDKAYNTKFNLKRHLDSIHLKKKRHQCSICYRWFASKQNLSEHNNLHTGAKPFSCSICGKLFRQLSQLSLHKRKHVLNSILPITTEDKESQEENQPQVLLSDVKQELTYLNLKFYLPPLRPEEKDKK